MKFTLSLCPTVNAQYSRSHYGIYKTQKARDWEKEAQIAILSTKGRKTLSHAVYVGIEYFLKTRRDIDGGKLILDALQANRVIENDDQVTHLNIKKYIDKKNPRIEVTVEPIDI